MIPSSTSLIKGLASADACARASRCGSPIRRNHLTPGGAKAPVQYQRREHMTISAQVIDTIVEWIDDNLHQPLRIDDIARHAGYSKWHLQRLFLQYKGESLGRYIRERKLLLLAARDLRDTDQRVYDICLKYGFDSPPDLCVFTRTFNLPPGAYRREPQSRLRSAALVCVEQAPTPTPSAAPDCSWRLVLLRHQNKTTPYKAGLRSIICDHLNQLSSTSTQRRRRTAANGEQRPGCFYLTSNSAGISSTKGSGYLTAVVFVAIL